MMSQMLNIVCREFGFVKPTLEEQRISDCDEFCCSTSASPNLLVFCMP